MILSAMLVSVVKSLIIIGSCRRSLIINLDLIHGYWLLLWIDDLLPMNKLGGGLRPLRTPHYGPPAPMWLIAPMFHGVNL